MAKSNSSTLQVPETKSKPGHDELVSQSMTQVDNYKVKPESFPYTSHVSVDTQSGHPHGFAEGKDKLAESMCESPRHLEDGGEGSGPGTPSEWGRGGTHFVVQTSKGESDEGSPSKVSISYSVDLKTGQITPPVHQIRNEEN